MMREHKKAVPFQNYQQELDGNNKCLICETTFATKGHYKRSWTFGFCCELCVNKASRTACRQNRRLRKSYGDSTNQIRGRLSCVDWIVCLYAHNFRCAECGVKSKRLTCDHIIPISQGGDNRFYNIQPLCRTCHDSKDNIKKIDRAA